MTDPTFLSCAAIRRYGRHLDDDLSPAERAVRLGIVADYARFCGRTPDEMVAEIFDEATATYRRRGFYGDRTRAFSEAGGGTAAEQLFRRNVVRAFFIANGRRLPPERPDWMRAS